MELLGCGLWWKRKQCDCVLGLVSSFSSAFSLLTMRLTALLGHRHPLPPWPDQVQEAKGSWTELSETVSQDKASLPSDLVTVIGSQLTLPLTEAQPAWQNSVTGHQGFYPLGLRSIGIISKTNGMVPHDETMKAEPRSVQNSANQFSSPHVSVHISV